MRPTIVTLSIAGALVTASPALAQNKLTLSGFVQETNSQETLPGAIIKIKGKETFVTTNEYGFYSLSLPPGDYELEVYFPGYVSDKTFPLNLIGDQKMNLDIAPQNTLEEVTVTAQSGQVANLRMGTHQMDVDQIRNVPALLGEKDVFKVIKLLPGVQKGQEGSSGFNVRGGGVDQNLIILDDAVVYNASHLFGFFSLFNGDALKGVELIKGGYPAKYGERLSSVLNMTMKDGDKERYKGEYGIGLLSSRATIEGPIVKNKASFLLSGRRTYADLLAQPILKAFGEEPAGYFFYDFNAKVNYTINDRNSIYLSGYFGRDKFYLNLKDGYGSGSKSNFKWGNATGTFRWNMLLSPKLFGNLTVNYSNYNMSVYLKEQYGGDSYVMEYLSAIDDIGAKYDLSYYVSDRHTVKTGYKITRHLFQPSVYTTIEHQKKNVTKAQDYISWEHNMYIDDEWKITKTLASNLGIRGSSFTTNGKTYFNLEPRASVRYLLNDLTSVKASYTVMNQYMHLVSSTGINMPTDLWVPATARVAPQRAKQYSAGLFHDLNIGKQIFNLSLEGYYKDMSNIVSYKEGASFMTIDDPTNGTGKPITFEDNVTSGLGKSYGTELMLQKQKGRFNGWLAYTLSWTKYHFAEINNGEWFYPRHDRRHDVNLVGFYEINKKIRLNALFTFATGNPVMLPRYQANIISDIPVDGNLSGSRGYSNYSLYTDKNTYRTEAYHRMDLGIQFLKQKKKGVRTWEISFYNVYNRQNPFFYNIEIDHYTSDQKLYKYTIFPFIPSITYSFKFN